MSALSWLRHSLQMADARKANPQPGEEHLYAVLERECELRRWCLDNHQHADRFYGQAAIWWQYMVFHANAQAMRYSNELGENEFHRLCAEWRAWRDEQLKTTTRYGIEKDKT